MFYFYNNKDKEKVDHDMIVATLEKSSELTTIKLHFKDIITYKDGSIPVINKASFSMSYEAVARIGINLKDVETKNIDNDKKVVTLLIPKAKVFDISINHKSIKFYDEHNALFKDEKNNTVEGLELAKKAAAKQIPKMGVLKDADQEAAVIIKGLLKDNGNFKDYKIIVKFKK